MSYFGLEQVKLGSHAGLDMLPCSLIMLFGPGLGFLLLLPFFLLLVLYKFNQACEKKQKLNA